jgi:flavin reductase (DIM6/NTAB) family NADH-FMN oxidoreductase RutF
MKQSIGPKAPAFPKPVWIVGTYDMDGKPNARL